MRHIIYENDRLDIKNIVSKFENLTMSFLDETLKIVIPNKKFMIGKILKKDI